MNLYVVRLGFVLHSVSTYNFFLLLKDSTSVHVILENTKLSCQCERYFIYTFSRSINDFSLHKSHAESMKTFSHSKKWHRAFGSNAISCCMLVLCSASTPEYCRLPAPSRHQSRSVSWHSGSLFPERHESKVDDCSCPTTWWISQECICCLHPNSNTYGVAKWLRHQKNPPDHSH